MATTATEIPYGSNGVYVTSPAPQSGSAGELLLNNDKALSDAITNKLQYQGAYSNTTAYALNSVVDSSGSFYICILANTGESPTNATYWTPVSSSGFLPLAGGTMAGSINLGDFSLTNANQILGQNTAIIGLSTSNAGTPVVSINGPEDSNVDLNVTGTIVGSLTGHASLDLAAANNLGDLANAATAVANLGLPRIFNVKTYGATGNGSTDDTAAIQAAIAAAYAAGGGIVFFPAGTYLCNTIQHSGTFNSLLEIPFTTFPNSMVSIELRGEYVAQASLGEYGSQNVSTTGAIIKTTQTSFTGTRPAMVSCGAYSTSDSSYSATALTIRSLTFLAPNNPALDGLQLSVGGPVRIFNTQVAVNTNVTNITQPTHGTYGLIMPGVGNTALSIVDDFYCQGFDSGFAPSEHTKADNLSFSNCNKAINPSINYNQSHGIQIGRALVQWCPYGVYIGGSNQVHMNIQNLDIEHAYTVAEGNSGATQAATWGQCIADIYDPNNYLVGEVYAYPTPSASLSPNPVYLTGGQNIKMTSATGTYCAHEYSIILAGGTGMTESGAFSGQYYYQTDAAQNDSFQAPPFYCPPGSYTFTANVCAFNAGGIITWYLDGNSIGTTDTYVSGVQQHASTISVTIPASSGWAYHTIKGIVASKNGSSGGFGALIQNYGIANS